MKQRGFRLDGLLLIPENHPSEPIYFLEAHSYKDDNFYNQLAGKIVLYLTSVSTTKRRMVCHSYL
ncbi:DUF2887 domain-containing protein [Rivularia sp. UHCC 0363]|uniref:DUF2887 domain-containing protein n=1 Tax=Rivularia sp. UHCC 0363 TaxID=3110244 RepID=UPI002B1EEB35|nr:DUF2887 domain-containing protein [Rivularia sp. UHCC 0363]MEA5599354.1 DUF2887 domain-containing protein [Rivularia sp. UHCC 0363]